MKVVFSKLFIVLFSTIFTLAVATGIYAACPVSGYTPTATDGINSGTATSLAGLIVHTKNNGVDANMSVTVSEGQTGGGIVPVTSTYASGTPTLSTYTKSTGTSFYVASQDAACSHVGYLFLGYGSSAAYGNTYALDCKTSAGAYYTFTVAVVPPAGVGHWHYSVGGTTHLGDVPSTSLANGVNKITFQAANGYTGVVTFNWLPTPQYVLSVSTAGTGAGSVASSPDAGIACGADCSETYYQGTTTTLTATPNLGSTFVGWAGCTLLTADNPPKCNVTINSAMAVTATFQQNTYVLTYFAGVGGSISGTTSQTVNHGASGTLVTAVPNAGYHFVNWSPDGLTMVSRIDPNVTANATYTANFAVNTSSTLNVVVSPAGAANLGGGGVFDTTYLEQSYTATVTNVNSTYNAIPVWSSSNPSFSCPIGHFEAGGTTMVTCTATFTLKPVLPTCSITATPNPSATTGGVVTLNYSTTNAVTATWTSGKTGSVSPLASGNAIGYGGIRYWINVTSTTGNMSSCTVQVNNPNTFSLTVNIDPVISPVVAIGTGVGIYTSGSTATIGFTGKLASHDFVNWTGSTGCSGAESHTIIMNENKVCTANFINTPPVVTLVNPVGNPTLTACTTSVVLEAFSVDNGNTQTLDFQVYGPNPSVTKFADNNWTEYVANNIHKTYTVTGLVSGVYRWRAQSYDGSLYSAWVEDYFTIPVCPPPQTCSDAPVVTLVSPVGNPSFPSGTTTVNLEAYSNDDCDDQTIIIQLYDPSGNQVPTATWSDYVANGEPVTRLATGLSTAGTYHWLAWSFDGSLYSDKLEDHFTILAPPIVYDLTCTISPPEGGNSPLVVKVTVTPTNVTAPYSYRMNADDPTNLMEVTGKSGEFYYTYPEAGTYKVQAYNEKTDWKSCTPTSFVVTDPTTGSGGEVSR
jgi:hypothetical protein